jgi:hypothetical protein
VTGEPSRPDELRTLVAAILAAWRITSAVTSAPREQAGAAGRIIECHNTPHSGCGDTQRPAGTFPAQALTSRRGGGRTRCTMNQAGAARLLAVVVLVAQAVQHLSGHPTWRGFGEFATMSGWPQPTWRRIRGWCAPAPVPARRPAQHRADGQGPDGAVRPLGRQLKGDGIEIVTLESTSGSAPSRARSGYSLRWASTSAGLPR